MYAQSLYVGLKIWICRPEFNLEFGAVPAGTVIKCKAYACKENDPFGRSQIRRFLFILQDAHLRACKLTRADFERLSFDQQQGSQKFISSIPATFVAYYLFRVRDICFNIVRWYYFVSVYMDGRWFGLRNRVVWNFCEVADGLISEACFKVNERVLPRSGCSSYCWKELPSNLLLKRC